jgi:CheY-like chemotaxis protein
VAEQRDFDKIEILLVDDRQENLLALEAVLASPDYKLIKVNSGDEALRYLLDHSPALILMDVQMPGLNGFETASIIKGSERTREIPIIFVTAINMDERFVHKGYDHGAVDYIYKPYDAHVLRSKVAVLAEIRRHHQRMIRLVAVQKATTQSLAEASNVDEAIPRVLNSICSSLGWDLGCFWKREK